MNPVGDSRPALAAREPAAGSGPRSPGPLSPQRAEELEAQPAERLSLYEVLQMGMGLLRQGRLDDATELYDTILWQLPDQPDALHYLGLIEHKRGNNERALDLMRRSLDRMPDQAWPWNNLGNVLKSQQRHREAHDAYRRCVEIDPTHAEGHANLGALLRRAGALEEAEAACREAIHLRPDFAVAWYQLSRVLIVQGRVHDGLVASSQAIALAPRDRDSRDGVCRALVMLGRLDEAAKLYREWLAEEPDNAIVRHHLAAIGGELPPARASDAYVRTVFDGFADSFDAKLASLDYRAPSLVGEHLARILPEPARQYTVADLGCGTGLCAPLVRPWSSRLVGCDLSGAMLEKARTRGGYDDLVEDELVAFLERHRATFDLLVSADTLCYFGDLHGVAVAAAAALRPGGRLVFTVEATDAPPDATDASPRMTDARGRETDAPPSQTEAPTGRAVPTGAALPTGAAVPTRAAAVPPGVAGATVAPGFVLQPHGRYAHGATFLVQALRAAGFVEPRLACHTLRREEGLPVRGWLVDATAPIGGEEAATAG